MKKTLIVMAVLFLVFAFIKVTVTEASTFNLQSLVCKWGSTVAGEGWKAISPIGREVTGDIYIKIKKVEGNKAWGEIYIVGRQSYHNQWLKFEAMLSEIDGGVALDSQVSTFILIHLEVRGDKMTGTGVATTIATFSLKRAASCGD